jgi:hypothetical protein
MPDVVSARCSCGRVRVRLRLPLLFASHCHCESCRRAHSAPFVTWTAVPPERLERDGTLVSYASSPGVERHFCPTCGSQMLFTAAGVDRVYVPVAALDAGCPIPVDSHVSIEERPTWVAGLELLPCFLAKSELPGRW